MGWIYLALLCMFCAFSAAYRKEHHPVPTYFGRRHPDGTLVDRSAPEFDRDIKKPFVNQKWRNDASIKLSPTVATNGGEVAVIWNGVTDPQEKDFIAFYCPIYSNPSHYLDYFYVSSSSTWKEGSGNYSVVVYNMRSTCVFKYWRAGSSYSKFVAESEELSFDKGGPEAPLQGHISMTTKPSEMRVMWVSGEVTKPAVVKYGLDKELSMEEYEYIIHTYTADNMCQAPANSTGFTHPGYVYDVVLRNLKPNTQYYYSFGSETQMSDVLYFNTPLPSGDKTPYKMVIYGDMGVSPGLRAAETANLVLDDALKNDVKFVFHHGDISYARGYAYIWEHWFAMIQPYSTLIPYMVGVGNHEQDHTHGGERDPSGAPGEGSWHPSWFNGGTDSGGECGVPMFKRFHMPDNGNAIWWYSFDYGMAHYIMMSTEHDYSPGSRQYTWLENDLRNLDRTVTPWVMIAGHRAMYCSEAYESDYVVSVNMQRLFEDLLYKYKVDLAFWAHYHSYERTCKVYKGKCAEDGITHIVVGSAGKNLDVDKWYPEEWSVVHKTDYGYGRVTIANSSALLYEWIQNDKQEVMDHVWLTK